MPPQTIHSPRLPAIFHDEADLRLQTIALKRMLAQQSRLTEIVRSAGTGSTGLQAPRRIPRLVGARALRWYHVDRFEPYATEGDFAGWAFVPEWLPSATVPFLVFEGDRDFLIPLARRHRPDVAAALQAHGEVGAAPAAPQLAASGLTARFSSSSLAGFKGRVHLCLVHAGETAAVCFGEAVEFPPTLPSSPR